MDATKMSTIALVEEKLHVDTDRVVTGRVRVSTESKTVEELAQASLAGERVEVREKRSVAR